MSLKKICLLMILFVPLLFFQASSQTKINRIEKLNNRNIITSEIEPGILKLKYPNGKIIYKNINEFPLQKSASQIPTTTIDLRTVDTSLYSNKYSFWQDVVVSNGIGQTILASDMNNNGLAELYGYYKDYQTSWDTLPFIIYEFNETNNKFEIKHRYADSIRKAETVYDINMDGQDELFLLSYGGVAGVVYKKDTDTSLATTLDLSYYRGNQINNPTFGDFDNDSNTDLVFYPVGELSTIILKYNSAINNFDSVYRFEHNEIDAGGYAIGDFDLDNKTDIVLGTISGKVHVIECEGTSSYSNVWSGIVETRNAYYPFTTKDIDNNGKPEFWIMGDSFYNNLPVTRITAFEAVTDNTYKAVHQIDLIGIFSLFAGNVFAKDFNDDGIEELFICIDQHVIILEFTGKKEHHDYNIYYFKRNELADSNSVYYGATAYDLTNDGVDEILITLDDDPPQLEYIKRYTKIYKLNSATSIEEVIQIEKSQTQFKLFPNPFNTSTTIEFNIPNSGFCIIKLYDILGNEIKTLLAEELTAGKYNINWNAADITSGIYYLQLQTNEFIKRAKAVLLK